MLYDVRCSGFAGFERYLQGGALQKRLYSGATLDCCEESIDTRGRGFYSAWGVANSLLLTIAPTSSKKYLRLPVLFLVAGMRGLPLAAAEMVSEKK